MPSVLDVFKAPGKGFFQEKKLPFSKVISFLLAMEGGTLTNELLNCFGCSAETASASAFVQQRSKLAPETLPALFDLFVQKTKPMKLYKGFRLLAADGSDIQIPNNPEHTASFYPGTTGKSPYNILHLDAVYDLLQHTDQDASVVGDREANKRAALCSMVDRSAIEKAILMADRGYEGFNLMAHIQEKNWKYLIRVKDIGQGGIAAGLTLPETEEFDVLIELSLTTKGTNEVKELFKQKNQYRCISSSQCFDFLHKKNRKYDPAVFYKLPFRIVRFIIADDSYETVSEALKKGKEVVDYQVENALLKRAMGYEYTEVMTEEGADGTKRRETVKQVVPDVTAQIYWLKNRRRDRWCDRPQEDSGDAGNQGTGVVLLAPVEEEP